MYSNYYLVSNLFFHPIKKLYFLKIWISISWRQLVLGSLLRYQTGCCLSKNRLDTKNFTVHLFSCFTIKTLRSLAALAPFGILIHCDSIITQSYITRTPIITRSAHGSQIFFQYTVCEDWYAIYEKFVCYNHKTKYTDWCPIPNEGPL